jgi:hypothetical protein
VKIHQIIVEYKREVTAKNLGPRLLASAERESITDVDQILAALEEMDPTPNKQYTLWLANQYIKQQFRLEDSPRIKDVLEKFINAKSRLEKKDINQYDLHSLEDQMDEIYNVELETPSEEGIFEVPEGAEVLYNGPLGLLAIPKTKKASCILGSGTKWCTAGDKKNQFAYYSKDGPLYIWRDKNGEKYQFHWESMQFMDRRDRPISQEQVDYFRIKHPVLKKLFAAKEKEIATDPKRAYWYAKDIIGGRWPEGEAAIATDPERAYLYAKDIIRGRWPEGEAAIAKHPYSAYVYAKDVIGGRWPEGEAAIAKNAEWAYKYATDVIGGRWPEAEAAIATDPKMSYYYAYHVIGGRWPEAEAVIAKDPERAYLYARDVIGGRWPEAEAVIAKDPERAYLYARDIIGGRWPEGEAAIAKNAEWAYKYARDVIRGRFLEGEAVIAKDRYWQSAYAEYVIPGK